MIWYNEHVVQIRPHFLNETVNCTNAVFFFFPLVREREYFTSGSDEKSNLRGKMKNRIDVDADARTI